MGTIDEVKPDRFRFLFPANWCSEVGPRQPSSLDLGLQNIKVVHLLVLYKKHQRNSGPFSSLHGVLTRLDSVEQIAALTLRTFG